MLFNSYEFILAFLPLVGAVFALLTRFAAAKWALHWLTLASIAFYAWWHPPYLALLFLSSAVNFHCGLNIAKGSDASRHRWLVGGIVFNIGLLVIFKYTAFGLRSINAAAGLDLFVPEIALPLAISFYTFTQITYLVDVRRNGKADQDFFHYLLFVVFFPHLIAGPIIHYNEIMPQFAHRRSRAEMWADGAAGLTFFAMGLGKKVLLADNLAPYASRGFEAAANGTTLTLAEAWGAAFAYTMQLYFDFSGYSDMAVGLALFFGIRLPINFFSPYKATSIIEFWRRWHITLSRFLRDYLYIPLGGNRRGAVRRHANLLTTMALGGFWHGAEWTFLIWGLLHGGFLMVNHAWHYLSRPLPSLGRLSRALSWGLTFLCVVTAWVFFRAADLDTALSMLSSMAGLNGVSLPLSVKPMFDAAGLTGALPVTFTGLFPHGTFGAPLIGLTLIGTALALALALPNTNQVMGFSYGFAAKGLMGRPWWRPSLAWAAFTGLTLAICLISLRRISEFIYFNF